MATDKQKNTLIALNDISLKKTEEIRKQNSSVYKNQNCALGSQSKLNTSVSVACLLVYGDNPNSMIPCSKDHNRYG